MRVKIAFLVILLVTPFLVNCNKKVPKETTGEVLAKIGDDVITLDEFNQELKSLPPYFQSRVATPAGKKGYLDKVITRKLLTQEAEKRGIDNDPEIQSKIKEYTDKLIVEKLTRNIYDERSTISEEEIKAYYDENISQFQTPERIKVAHIQVEIEAIADNILKRIKDGEDFSKLAMELSTDERTKDNGGELGYLRRGTKSKEFDDAAFSLEEAGDISEVIKDHTGYHIIKLIDKELPKSKEFELVRSQIERRLKSMKQREVYEKFLDELKANAKIEINEQLLSKNETE